MKSITLSPGDTINAFQAPKLLFSAEHTGSIKILVHDYPVDAIYNLHLR